MFEVFCYTAAIVFVLWIRSTPAPHQEKLATVTAPEPEPIVTPEPVLEEEPLVATAAATISTPVATLVVEEIGRASCRERV